MRYKTAKTDDLQSKTFFFFFLGYLLTKDVF